MSNQSVTSINLDQLLEESGTFQYTNHETGSIVPLVIVAIIVIVGLNFVSDLIKASVKNERHSSRKDSRSHIPAKLFAKDFSKAEELPELAPVAVSAAPKVEPPVTAVPVVEPAPAPIIDPTLGWSRPVVDEAALSTPAYIRRAGITPYAACRRLNPLKVPVVLLRARKPELDSEPVFDYGERLPVGFDGVPVH